jgi:hypothetical protein
VIAGDEFPAYQPRPIKAFQIKSRGIKAGQIEGCGIPPLNQRTIQGWGTIIVAD